MAYRDLEAANVSSPGDMDIAPPSESPNRSPLVFVGVILALAFSLAIISWVIQRRRPNSHRGGRIETAGSQISCTCHVQPKGVPTIYSEWRETSGVLEAGVRDAEWERAICAICLEEIQDEDLIRGLKCLHVFHSRCADDWHSQSKGARTCPICRRE